MPYQVVEKITNVTDVVYETLDDFINLCYRNGYDRETIIRFGSESLVKKELGTLEESVLFLEMSNSTSSSYGEWDLDTQSVVKTKVFNSEDDYLFMKDISAKVYTRPVPRFTRTVISAGEI